MIFNEETALRWLVHHAQVARNAGWSSTKWLRRIDPNGLAIAMAYVSERQLRAIRELVWGRKPFL